MGRYGGLLAQETVRPTTPPPLSPFAARTGIIGPHPRSLEVSAGRPFPGQPPAAMAAVEEDSAPAAAAAAAGESPPRSRELSLRPHATRAQCSVEVELPVLSSVFSLEPLCFGYLSALSVGTWDFED